MDRAYIRDIFGYRSIYSSIFISPFFPSCDIYACCFNKVFEWNIRKLWLLFSYLWEFEQYFLFIHEYAYFIANFCQRKRLRPYHHSTVLYVQVVLYSLQRIEHLLFPSKENLTLKSHKFLVINLIQQKLTCGIRTTVNELTKNHHTISWWTELRPTRTK